MSKKKYDERAILSILLELYEITKYTGNLKISSFLRDKKISFAFGTVLVKERLLVKVGKNMYYWNTGMPNINTAIKTIKLVRDTHNVHTQTWKEKIIAEAEVLERQKLEEQTTVDTIQQEVFEEKISLEQQLVENEDNSASAKFEEDMQFFEEQEKLFKQAKIENYLVNEKINDDIEQELNEEMRKPKFDLRNNKPKHKIEKQVSKPIKERKISIFWGAILIKW